VFSVERERESDDAEQKMAWSDMLSSLHDSDNN
jgi:hypothetical protein